MIDLKSAFVLFAAMTTVGGVSADALAAHHEILGRWNITVNEGPHAYPSWIKVEEKDGKYMGRFLGRAGGVDACGEVKFENGNVEFNAHNRKWTGKLEGDMIQGTTGDGKEKWIAKRAVYRYDVTGTWEFNAGRQGRQAKLTLKQDGDKVTGTMGGGREITDVSLNDGVLKFTLPAPKNGSRPARQITAKVKGDVLEGEGGRGKFVARRQREWGEPIELFNGKDLTGWKPLDNPNNYKWGARDGIMYCEGGSANIVTERSDFRDFKLHVEFRVPERGNSGVYLRGRHEVQIAENYGQDPSPGGCGSMYSRLVASTNASKKAGEWQTFDITLINNYVTVIHNGTTIIDNQELEGITGGAMDSNEAAPGPIYLQGDHSAVEYRKLTLSPAKG